MELNSFIATESITILFIKLHTLQKNKTEDSSGFKRQNRSIISTTGRASLPLQKNELNLPSYLLFD